MIKKNSFEEKGAYALFSMLLLRPWRCPYLAIKSWIGDPKSFRGIMQENVWLALYDAYSKWREQLKITTAPFFSRNPNNWMPAPPFGTELWWNCRVHTIVENMDMAFARPGNQVSKVPDIHGLPRGVDSDASDAAKLAHHSFGNHM